MDNDRQMAAVHFDCEVANESICPCRRCGQTLQTQCHLSGSVPRGNSKGMPPDLETLLEPLRHSPQLVEVVDALQAQIAQERDRRASFYEEMTPDQKVEFVDGEVILHSPAKNRHLDATRNILMLLTPFVQMNDLGEVKSEKCLCVFPRNDYEPDIVFFSKAKATSLQPDTMKFPIPDLVIEVMSESTEQRDRGVKFEDFQAHGVGEYWLIDVENEIVEQYRLRGSVYELALKSGTGEIRSDVIADFTAPIRAFFDTDENLVALRGLIGDVQR
ncbi:MAG: Uma2 family endonuclease [Verrucomicrobiales bacterium]|jgi:Uma2 family endonuclease